MHQIHCFQLFFLSSKSFQILSQCVLQMHIVFIYFSAVPNCLKYHQNACLRDIVFNMFSAVPNRFKCRQNACFRESFPKMFSAVPNRFKYLQSACFEDIDFKMFSEVPNRFKYRHNACFRCTLFSKYFSAFLIRFKYRNVTIHALDVHCFQLFLCSSKLFQYHQNACFKDIVFMFFSEVSNCFKYLQSACLKGVVLQMFQIVLMPSECVLQRHCFPKMSLQFQIISNIVRMYALETSFSKRFLWF